MDILCKKFKIDVDKLSCEKKLNNFLTKFSQQEHILFITVNFYKFSINMFYFTKTQRMKYLIFLKF